jgi:hypothetical protein
LSIVAVNVNEGKGTSLRKFILMDCPWKFDKFKLKLLFDSMIGTGTIEFALLLLLKSERILFGGINSFRAFQIVLPPTLLGFSNFHPASNG